MNNLFSIGKSIVLKLRQLLADMRVIRTGLPFLLAD
jgi:hypothetical protein